MENSLKVSIPAQQSMLVRAIAYYRHSAQDQQENSNEIQKDQVRQRALDHGIEIIHEFCDIGPSGLDSAERPGFTEMMKDWIKQRSDFAYILCFDASRWGRFSGNDLSARSIEICLKHKQQLIYTSTSNRSENDPFEKVCS